MSSEVMNILIKAQDMASGVMKGVAGSIQAVESKAQALASGGLNSLKGGFEKLGGAVKLGATALGGFAAIAGGIALKSAASMETMNIALETAFAGNQQAAQEAGKAITEFATKTPYELQEVMTGFIKLKNMGLDPSQRALTAYGNTASAMGKGLNDMVEAVADAATGEFERLKEFGIRASKQGDQVKFTFKGVEKTVGNSSAEIEKYLIGLGETNFAGGMEKQSQSLSGLMSTLKDTISLTLGQLAKDTGLLDGVKFAVTALTNALAKIDPAPINNAVDSFKNLYNIIFKSDYTGGFFGFGEGEDSAIVDRLLNVKNAFSEVIELFTTGLQSPDSGGYIEAVLGVGSVEMLLNVKNTVLELIPVLQSLVTQGLKLVGDYIQFWVDNVLPLWIGIFQRIVDIVKFAGPYIMDVITAVFNVIQPIMQQIATQVFPLILPAIDAMIGAFKAILPVVMPVILFFVALIGSALSGVGQTFMGLVQIITGVFQIIQGIFTGDGEKVKEGFLNIFKGIENTVGGIFKGIFNAIITTINSGIGKVNELIGKIPEIPGIGKVPSIPTIPKFANGGVVGGSSTIGDKILARVNSGEVILNQKQQESALAQMSGGGEKIVIQIDKFISLGTEKDKRSFVSDIADALELELIKRKLVKI